MKKKDIHILVTIDDNYIEPLRVMLYSLVKNNSHRNLNIYLIYQSLCKSNLLLLKKTMEKLNVKFISIHADRTLFQNAPKREHITNATYLRLLASQLLPNNIDKVLYLDADIIIDGAIDDFYDINMEKFYFAGVKDHLDTSDHNFHKKAIGMPVQYTYICAGILLMNLKILREEFNITEIYKFIEKKGIYLTMQDQDIINALYYNKIKVVSCIYGKEAWFFNIENNFIYLISILFHREEKPIIIHYLYKHKPWKKNYIGRYMKIYWKYAKIFKKHKNYKLIKKNYNIRHFLKVKGYLEMILNWEDTE